MKPYDPNDEGLDSLDGPIADYFSRRLDPQRGRALAAFRNAACDGSPAISGTRAAIQSRRSRRWFAAVAALAAASLLALVWAARRTDDPTRPVVESPPPRLEAPQPELPEEPPPQGEVHVEQVAVIANTQPRVVEELIRFRTIDEGIVVIDGRRPVRKLRRQWLERIAWLDADTGARLEQTVPREELVYVDVPMN